MRQLKVVLLLMLLLPQMLFAEEDKDIKLKDIDGVERKIADYQGKWVVVNFWATWCPPCRKEMPDLVDFHNRHQGVDAVVLGIHFDVAPEAKIRDFLKEYHIAYPIISMEPGAMGPYGAVPGLPTTYLFDPTGKKVAVQTGPITSESIEMFMQRYAQKQGDKKTQ